MLLCILIGTESNFDGTVVHAIKEVKGMAAIHTKYHNGGNTFEEHIDSAAKILSNNYRRYNDKLLAVKAYKGWSKLGEEQAMVVMKKYKDTYCGYID